MNAASMLELVAHHVILNAKRHLGHPQEGLDARLKVLDEKV